MPKRIQRKRSRGWRMPAGAVYVGRPTKWGNPFLRVNYFGPHTLVGLYRDYLAGHLATWPEAGPALAELARKELRGKDLACWCPLDQPCHADVLLELANR